MNYNPHAISFHEVNKGTLKNRDFEEFRIFLALILFGNVYFAEYYSESFVKIRCY